MSFFGLHGMFGAQNFFGQVWGNSGKFPSHPQKFACPCTYVLKHLIAKIDCSKMDAVVSQVRQRC